MLFHCQWCIYLHIHRIDRYTWVHWVTCSCPKSSSSLSLSKHLEVCLLLNRLTWVKLAIGTGGNQSFRLSLKYGGPFEGLQRAYTPLRLVLEAELWYMPALHVPWPDTKSHRWNVSTQSSKCPVCVRSSTHSARSVYRIQSRKGRRCKYSNFKHKHCGPYTSTTKHGGRYFSWWRWRQRRECPMLSDPCKW